MIEWWYWKLKVTTWKYRLNKDFIKDVEKFSGDMKAEIKMRKFCFKQEDSLIRW